jgi:murein DD-endopeptidase MepM/ murein hydrolase activator NlpD
MSSVLFLWARARRLRRSAAASGIAILVAAPAAVAHIVGRVGEQLPPAPEPEAPRAGSFAVPLRGPLESPFGYRWGRLHAGLDIAVLRTDRVHAAYAGTVARVGYLSRYAGYGNSVVIRHGNGLVTLYAHLASFRVRVGEQVSGGELIGRAGCTGSCTGAHLHFELRERGRPVNPMRYLPRLDAPSVAKPQEETVRRTRRPGRDALHALLRLGRR